MDSQLYGIALSTSVWVTPTCVVSLVVKKTRRASSQQLKFKKLYTCLKPYIFCILRDGFAICKPILITLYAIASAVLSRIHTTYSPTEVAVLFEQ